MSKSLRVGDKIPHFRLKNQYNEYIDSKSLYSETSLVLFFYPKDDTPGCTLEVCTFRDQFEKFLEAGARVVGISADSTESHKAFVEKFKLPYTLLTDADHKLRKQFGVPKSLLGLLHGRVTYIIDNQGTILHIINSQLNINKHIHEALNVLQSAGN